MHWLWTSSYGSSDYFLHYFDSPAHSHWPRLAVFKAPIAITGIHDFVTIIGDFARRASRPIAAATAAELTVAATIVTAIRATTTVVVTAASRSCFEWNPYLAVIGTVIQPVAAVKSIIIVGPPFAFTTVFYAASLTPFVVRSMPTGGWHWLARLSTNLSHEICHHQALCFELTWSCRYHCRVFKEALNREQVIHRLPCS